MLKPIYVDKKRYVWLLSLIFPSAPIIGIWAAQATGWGIFYATALIIFYLIVPILDILFPEDPNNPPESVLSELEEDSYYRVLPRLTIPVHYISLFVCAWWVSAHSLAWWEFLLLTLSLGFVNGLAINTGHELGHKKESIDRWLAKFVLAVVGYGHFFIEHNKGHHRFVATPEDPATSRMGENIYKFALREIPGAFFRSWNLERDRLRRNNKNVWNWDNEILQPLAVTLLVYGTLTAIFGSIMLVFLPIQAAFGWWQLTSANYIEHYGLLRQKSDDGRYEQCQPRHSWNSNHLISNFLLFHIQRHSDHHAHPTRHYQSLRHFEDSPQMPNGYGGMFGLALFTPLFRALMDPRVVSWADGNLEKIQIDEAHRAEIYKMYGKTKNTQVAQK